ncbi:hypothetical protein N5J09_25210 [Aeromonas caviae]|nr:hypothetical protein [Aeromonas caviae]MDH1400095.1 hypothetical protein [Aeromonas caviae]
MNTQPAFDSGMFHRYSINKKRHVTSRAIIHFKTGQHKTVIIQIIVNAPLTRRFQRGNAITAEVSTGGGALLSIFLGKRITLSLFIATSGTLLHDNAWARAWFRCDSAETVAPMGRHPISSYS